jgi:tetratricopeptide (TPR) repeat protein
MIVFSTFPGPQNLLKIAQHFIQNEEENVNEAYELVSLLGVTIDSWEMQVLVANIFAKKGELDKVEKILSRIDFIKYFDQATRPGQIYLFLNVLVNADRACEAVALLESTHIIGRFSHADNLNISIMVANGLLNEGHSEKAKNTLFKIDVENAYTENPDLKNAYARIGWNIYWREKNYAKVIEWIEKDLNMDGIQYGPTDHRSTMTRLSPAWRCRYAQALAAQGDVTAAREQVAEAYAADKTLKDGYARIAWAHFYKKQDYASIRLWIERDEKNRELSPAWQLQYARVIAKTEGIEAALPMIEKACNEEPKLENAYCSIAWEHYVPKDHAFEKVIPYFEKDYQRGHPTGRWQALYAVALSFIGRGYEAEKFVKNAYKANNQLVNGFARCGWVRYYYCGYAPDGYSEHNSSPYYIPHFRHPRRISV